MKKIVKMVTVAALSVFLLAGCGASGGGETIKLAGIFELTNDAAQYGNAGLKGAQLAIKQQNAQGGVLGKQIELIQADNKSEPGESTAQATKLASQGVVGFLGPMTTKTTMAIIPIVTQNQLPLITPAGTGEALTIDPNTGKLNEWIFRACFMDRFQGEVGAQFALKDLKVKKVALLIDSSGDYAKGLGDAFTEVFTAGGGQIVAAENYVAKDTEFKAVLNLIKAKKPEAIYVPGYYNEVGAIIKQARESGITVPIFGGDGFNGDETTKIAGAGNMTEIYYTDHLAPDDEFIKAYEAEYKEKPTGFAALGYDAAKMMLTAIEKAGSTDTQAIRGVLENIKDFQGVTGLITVDPATHNPSKSVVILKYEDGEWVLTSRVDPQ